MNNFITVAIFQYPHEAYVIKGRLESEGIEVFLQDELTVQTYNFISNAVGGIKLQVKESDIEKATSILKSAGVFYAGKQKNKNKAYDIIDNFPLFERQSTEVKLVLYIAIILVFSAIILFLTQIPRKEERLAEKEKKERLLKEKRLKFLYLPKADSLVESNPKEAIGFIKRLNKICPENADLYDNLGIAYFYVDSFGFAIDCFEKSMDFGGYKHPRGLSNIAICKIKLGDFDGAIANLISASDINYDYWVDLGYAYEAKGDLKNAVKYFTKYIDKRKENNNFFGHNSDFKYLVERTDSIRNRIN